MMNERSSLEEFAARLHETAREFPYPVTPDLVNRPRPVRNGVVRWQAATLAMLLLIALLAVPSVRAAVLRIFQIGAVRVVVMEQPSQQPLVPQSTPDMAPTKQDSVLMPTALPGAELLGDLAGETTLGAARTQVPFPILLPTYPPDLGPPDRVFVQELDGSMLVLVWLDPVATGKVRMSLHTLTSTMMIEKQMVVDGKMKVIRELKIAGEPALWVRGPHAFQIRDSTAPNKVYKRLVDGNVLIWLRGGLTYRLETTLPLEEALQVAESLAETDAKP